MVFAAVPVAIVRRRSNYRRLGFGPRSGGNSRLFIRGGTAILAAKPGIRHRIALSRRTRLSCLLLSRAAAVLVAACFCLCGFLRARLYCRQIAAGFHLEALSGARF